MSNGQHIAARMEDALVEAIDEVAAQGRTSRSEVLRDAVRDHVLNSDGVELPDHVEREVRRERLKRRNKLKWQRIHFPSNVADRFRRAFEQGDLDAELNPGAVDEIREIHVEDARLLFEDDPDRRESVIEFIDSVADHAREAEDASAFDALDPEEMFAQYAGVEEAREEERRSVEDVNRALEMARHHELPNQPIAAARKVAKFAGVDLDTAEDAVDAVRGEGGDRDE